MPIRSQINDSLEPIKVTRPTPRRRLDMNVRELAEQVSKGDRRALARAISLVEGASPESARLMRLVSKNTGRAFVIGVTGPPGTGKSTLVDRLIVEYRRLGLRVGVVAVDPTSPISGGALLGDRVRMLDHTLDRGVYIRSMATRGWTGGLSRAAAQAVRLLDAAAMDIVLVETVGIGQSDIEVVGVAHAVVVVLMPGLGDDIQMSKAGLMEVGDVYVVNKSDLEGADTMVVGLLALVRTLKGRSPAVLKVSALRKEGLDRLVQKLEALRGTFKEDGHEMKLRSARGMILEVAKGEVLSHFASSATRKADALASQVVSGKLTVEQAAQSLLD